MRSAEEIQAMIPGASKLRKEMLYMCLAIIREYDDLYIKEELKHLQSTVKILVTRGRKFYIEDLKVLRRKIKWLKFIINEQGKKTTKRSSTNIVRSGSKGSSKTGQQEIHKEK